MFIPSLRKRVRSRKSIKTDKLEREELKKEVEPSLIFVCMTNRLVVYRVLFDLLAGRIYAWIRLDNQKKGAGHQLRSRGWLLTILTHLGVE